MAIGREAVTDDLGLDDVGVQRSPKNKKLVTSSGDQTNVSHIYGVGDVLDGKPELTPVAIQAGRLLAQRLYAGQKTEVRSHHTSHISTSIDLPALLLWFLFNCC